MGLVYFIINISLLFLVFLGPKILPFTKIKTQIKIILSYGF